MHKNKLKKADYARQVMDIIAKAAAPEKLEKLLADWLDYAYKAAEKHNSPKHIQAYMEFVTGQTMGTPARRQMGDTSQYDNLKAILEEMAEGEQEQEPGAQADIDTSADALALTWTVAQADEDG